MFLSGPASRLSKGDVRDEVRIVDDNSLNPAEYARHVEEPAGWKPREPRPKWQSETWKLGHISVCLL